METLLCMYQFQVVEVFFSSEMAFMQIGRLTQSLTSFHFFNVNDNIIFGLLALLNHLPFLHKFAYYILPFSKMSSCCVIQNFVYQLIHTESGLFKVFFSDHSCAHIKIQHIELILASLCSTLKLRMIVIHRDAE